MCTEIHTRFRPCAHTRFARWDYCSVIIPSDRVPETGRACRRHTLKYKEMQERDGGSGRCLECMKTRALRGG
ncbi:hypothetical protein EK21DRAFT_38251, partial [Setomelanomma holmii]